MNLRRFADVGFYFFLIVFLSSCFEIVEDVSFKKNGSGTFKYLINLSQSKTEINSLMRLDSSSGFRIPKTKEINENLEKVEYSLKNSEGISNVSVKSDFKSWIFEINADFDKCENLEKALNKAISSLNSKNKFLIKDVFTFAGNTMQRNMIRISSTDIKNANKGVLKKILSAANYTTIYRFENTIETQSNPKAKVSPSKKAVMLKCNLLKLLNGKETLLNIIKIH